MKRLLSWCGVAVAAVVLSGCAGDELGRSTGMTPTGSDFNKALYGEYIALSQKEFNEGDYGNSDKFAVRARSSAANTTVQPEEMSARRIPADKVSDLTTARGRLATALNAGARERLPRDAAKAQAMFDCWMEETEEANAVDPDLEACRAGFFDALAKIEVAPAAPPPAAAGRSQTFAVYFDFNKSTLTDAGKAEVNRAVAHARAINAQFVVLEGHADRSGANPYNMRLSQARVATVKQAIQASGVNVQFRDSAEGEARPPVPTADGVREQRNRVVIVRVVQ
jgi:OOP family OmpA-OmpF porin